MEEDKKLKELFVNFRPDLTPDECFMEHLERNLAIIESLKQQNAAMKRRNRNSLIMASLAGFIVGVILALLLPWTGEIITTVSLSLPNVRIDLAEINREWISWVVLATLTTLTSLSVYEISMIKQNQ